MHGSDQMHGILPTNKRGAYKKTDSDIRFYCINFAIS